MRGGGRSALAALLAALAATAGCGSGEEAAAPAPERCIESWNDDEAALRFGRHVYDTHDSHRAQVALLKAEDGNPNIAAGGDCAVIFAVPGSDVEYGTVGLVVTDLGWAPMQELARDDVDALNRIQADASGAVNASLFPDGSIEPN